MKQVIKEEQLKQIIAESINKILFESEDFNDADLNEEEMDEGMWNQLKTGAKTFFSNNNGNKSGLRDRWNSAKKNYATQGQYDELSTVIQGLSNLLDDRKINPNTTVAQLVGGKYNNGKFGTMTGMLGNRQRQMNSRM